MEFWGVEVKPNQTVKCEPGEEKYLHLSHAALAELKKAAENVVIYVTFNKQKLVIGTLSAEKCAQLNYDLVFEKEFELSHNSKTATVHFTGYKSLGDGGLSDFDEIDSEDEEEEAEVAAKTNGAIKAKPAVEKDDKAQKTKAGKPSKVEPKADDDDDSDDDEDSDDEDMVEAGDSDEEDDDSDDEEEDDDDSSEEEETPKPAKGKKRPAEAAKKEAESEKKSKLATPADSKKGGEAKKGTTTPAKSDKGKQQTPKSAGSVSCKSCTKTFNSEGALDSHTKAKHVAK